MKSKISKQYKLKKEKGKFLLKVEIRLFLTTNNDNYVNKLSTWAAYFIFPHSVGYFAKCWWYRYTVTHKFRTV